MVGESVGSDGGDGGGSCGPGSDGGDGGEFGGVHNPYVSGPIYNTAFCAAVSGW